MSREHEELFERYVAELGAAKVDAEAWWEERLRKEHRDPVVAEQRLRERWRFGAAAHPRIIAVLREFYLECDRLNLRLAREDEQGTREHGQQRDEDEEREVYPTHFVADRLMEAGHEELGAFIAPLSYWPIGGDENNEPI